MPETLTDAIKSYLHLDWMTESSDISRLRGMIDRGKARLNSIAGQALNFDVEGLPRSLLFDYVRYANSQALEVFETNFQSELLSLNINANLGEYDESGGNDAD